MSIWVAPEGASAIGSNRYAERPIGALFLSLDAESATTLRSLRGALAASAPAVDIVDAAPRSGIAASHALRRFAAARKPGELALVAIGGEFRQDRKRRLEARMAVGPRLALREVAALLQASAADDHVILLDGRFVPDGLVASDPGRAQDDAIERAFQVDVGRYAVLARKAADDQPLAPRLAATLQAFERGASVGGETDDVLSLLNWARHAGGEAPVLVAAGGATFAKIAVRQPVKLDNAPPRALPAPPKRGAGVGREKAVTETTHGAASTDPAANGAAGRTPALAETPASSFGTSPTRASADYAVQTILPRRLRIGAPGEVVATAARDEIAGLVVSATLQDPEGVFEIAPLSPVMQSAAESASGDALGPVVWRWRVTPKAWGEFPLVVEAASFRATPRGPAKGPSTSVRVFASVSLNYARIVLRSLLWLGVAVLGYLWIHFAVLPLADAYRHAELAGEGAANGAPPQEDVAE